MAEKKRSKYLTKTVKFAGQSLVLYSLDGLTWSTKRQELQSIKERQDNQRVTLAGIKDEEEESEASESPDKSEAGDDDVEICAAQEDEDADGRVAKRRTEGAASSAKGAAAKSGAGKQKAAIQRKPAIRNQAELAPTKVSPRRPLAREGHKNIEKPDVPAKTKTKIASQANRGVVANSKSKKKAA